MKRVNQGPSRPRVGAAGLCCSSELQSLHTQVDPLIGCHCGTEGVVHCLIDYYVLDQLIGRLAPLPMWSFMCWSSWLVERCMLSLCTGGTACGESAGCSLRAGASSKGLHPAPLRGRGGPTRGPGRARGPQPALGHRGSRQPVPKAGHSAPTQPGGDGVLSLSSWRASLTSDSPQPCLTSAGQ